VGSKVVHGDQRNLGKQWFGGSRHPRRGCDRLGVPDHQKLSAEESLTVPPNRWVWDTPLPTVVRCYMQAE